MRATGETRHALYRFYDAHENLLYVGISGDPWRRWREHVRTQPWYPQVVHWAGTWYASEELAGAAEDRAIRSERPRFNIAGAIRPPEARFNVSFSAAVTAMAAWAAVPAVLDMALMTLVALPVHLVAPRYITALGWTAIAADITLPVPVIAVLLIVGAPGICRFGCWLDRNFGEQARRHARQREAAAAAERDARRIPPVVWILEPRRTYRVRQRMRAGGPQDYLLALEEEMDRQMVADLNLSADEIGALLELARERTVS